MKRVAIVINSLKKGGAEKQAALLANTLSGLYEVRIFVMRPEEGLAEELIDLSGGMINVEALWGHRGSGIRRLYRGFRQWHPDVVFCYLTYSNVVGAVAGRLCGIKYIYQGLRNAYTPIGKVLLDWVANSMSTGVILNNYAGLDFYKNRNFKNIIVIENYFPCVRETRKHESSKNVTVVTAARFVKQKDYRTALEAFRIAIEKAPDLRYRIIGYGEYESAIRAWVSDFGISDSVEIIINPPNVQSLIDECDIYLSTSIWEGTSNSIMEAMDASLPVVATAVGDNCRLVIDGETGFLLESGNVSGIADALIALARSEDMRNEMGTNGNRRLAGKYGVDKFRESYLKLIKLCGC